MTCQHFGNTLSSPFLTPPLTQSSVYTELWTGDAQKVILLHPPFYTLFYFSLKNMRGPCLLKLDGGGSYITRPTS